MKLLLTLNIHSFVAEMNQYNMNGLRGVYRYSIWILILVAVQFFNACKSDGLDVGITNESVGVNTADTLTIEASTFLLDPLPTTGQGEYMDDRIKDEEFVVVR